MKKILIILLILSPFNFVIGSDKQKKILLNRVVQHLPNIKNISLKPGEPNKIGRGILRLTNRFRANQGLPRLVWSQDLFRIAKKHAQQMANGVAPFSHDKFNNRVSQFSKKPKSAGENLFKGNAPRRGNIPFKFEVKRRGKKQTIVKNLNGIEQLAFEGWKHSPMHRKNMLGKFNTAAIGVARSPSGQWYMTQLFALY